MVDVGGSATGEIETAGDEDWFRVTLESGREYVIDLEGSPTGGGSLGDPLLIGIFDSGGTLIPGTKNDDSGTGFNSRLVFTPEEGGTHFISAGAIGGGTGDYTVSLEEVSGPADPLDDFASNTSTAGAVDVGGSATGEIETAGDKDWFRVTLDSGREYVIGLEGAPTDGGSLGDPLLVGLYDSGGTLIPGTKDDDGGTGFNSRLVFTPEQSGTHFISAGAIGVGTGDYTVSVKDDEVGSSNDPPLPVNSEFIIDENTPAGTPVGTVVANDQDGDTLSYEITAGNTGDAFEIDASTGDITVKNVDPLDFETTPRFELTVEVTDDGTPTLSNTATITIDLNDVIDDVFDLSALNGRSGFRLEGIDPGDRSGFSVSAAGDINGDGFGDVIIGAYGADPGRAGESYLVFGKASGFAASLDLSTLDGRTGYRFEGIDPGDRSGFSVSGAGDVDGDGLDDLIIGAPGSDFLYDGFTGYDAGESYLVFGDSLAALDAANGSVDGVISLADLDVTTGFLLDVSVLDYDGYNSGLSVSSAGDVNGDGFDDLIIGAPGSNYYGFQAGESYLVFGGARVDLDAITPGVSGVIGLLDLDGTTGFSLQGIVDYDYSGLSVKSAGDVDGDGLDDLIIGAPGLPGYDAGRSYLVFGDSLGDLDALTPAAGAIDLFRLDGTTGFAFEGIDADDQSGFSVSGAGDVDGDGLDDLIIGAYLGDPGDLDAGEIYLVLGAGLGALDAVDGTNDGIIFLENLDQRFGFRLEGKDDNDHSGVSVSSAGDFDGDGLDDLIIGASGGDSAVDAGEIYVLFGAGLIDLDTADGTRDGVISLGNLDGTTGFRLDGIDQDDLSGVSVSSAGDVNGDGFDDLIIGAYGADPGGDNIAGESYVVFGGNFTGSVTILGTLGPDELLGSSGRDIMNGAQGDDFLNGFGGSDLLTGGEGDDLFFMSRGTGNDKITDFTPGAGSVDVIDVSEFGFADLFELTAAADDATGDTVITLDVNAGDSATLIGIRILDLHADDFNF